MIIDVEDKMGIFIHIPKCGGDSVSKTLFRYLPEVNITQYVKLITQHGLDKHSTLCDYRKFLGDKKIKEYFVFSIVRNPWERMVSQYCNLIKNDYNLELHKDHILNFSDFIQLYGTKIIKYSIKGYDQYLYDNKSHVNFTGKLENINEDLIKIGQNMNIEIKEILHHNKTTEHLIDYEKWQDYYNPRTKDIVYEIFKKDIKKYDYTFEK